MQRQTVTQQEYERIKAMLGADAEQFKRTKLGEYILDRCANEVEQAVTRLKKADPKDEDGIRELQNDIWKHETFELWLDDAIHSGHLAMQNLEVMEAHDDEHNFKPPEEDSGDYISPPELPGE
jgi:hypothetical protein